MWMDLKTAKMEKVQDRELWKANLEFDRNAISSEVLQTYGNPWNKKINEQLIFRKFWKYWGGL